MISNGNMDQPYVIPTTVSGKYIVPLYEPITYDALTSGYDPTCGGYFNISKAYGYDGGNGSLNPFKFSSAKVLEFKIPAGIGFAVLPGDAPIF